MGIPKRAMTLVLALSANSLGVSYLLIVVAAYLPLIGLTASDVGLILGIEGIVMVASAIPFGLLSDRKGRKWVMVLGAAGSTPVFLIFAFTASLPYLLVASAISGLSEGAFLSSLNAILADLTTQENRNRTFSFSFVLSTVAYGIGSAIPFFFPAVGSALGVTSLSLHRDVFVVFAAVGVTVPIAVWLVMRDFSETKVERSSLSTRRHLGRIVKFSTSNGFIGFGAGFIIPLIPTWPLLKFGVQDVYSGPLLAASSMAMGLAAVASPRLAKKYGAVKTIAFNEAASTLFMPSLAFAGDAVLAGVLYIARAALMNMASPISDSFLMSIVSPEERGLASSINVVIWRIPNSLTTIGGGFILMSGNFSLPFYLASGFYATGIFLFYLFFRNTRVES